MSAFWPRGSPTLEAYPAESRLPDRAWTGAPALAGAGFRSHDGCSMMPAMRDPAGGNGA